MPVLGKRVEPRQIADSIRPGSRPSAAAGRAAVTGAQRGRLADDLRTSGLQAGIAVHRSEASGLFSADPAARSRLVAGLARIEERLDDLLAGAEDSPGFQTLDLSRGLVAEIGRRLRLIQASAEGGSEIR